MVGLRTAEWAHRKVGKGLLQLLMALPTFQKTKIIRYLQHPFDLFKIQLNLNSYDNWGINIKKNIILHEIWNALPLEMKCFCPQLSNWDSGFYLGILIA